MKFPFYNKGVWTILDHFFILRDGVEEFLSKTFEHWNIFVNTKGRIEYAKAIFKVLDPTNKYHLKENF